jgi:iron complex transport system ATP-binding protein
VRAEVRRLSVIYGDHWALRDVSADFGASRVHALIGPNGAGKSTLLKCLAGMQRHQGQVRLGDRTVGFSSRVPDGVGYLPQSGTLGVSLTVFEVVLMGRLQFLGLRVSSGDMEQAESLLDLFGIAGLAGKRIGEISGGERQLVLIAQALMRQPRLLLLDEPGNNLDLRNQLQTLEFMQRISSAREVTVIAALHDLGMAARFADTVTLLRDGRLHASGSPADVLTEKTIAEVYGIGVDVSSKDGVVSIVPTRVLDTKPPVSGAEFQWEGE